MTPAPQRLPKAGDIIQTGMIYSNGDGSIVWGSHHVVRSISSDGTLWYRPRDAKVDKCPHRWRFPIEPREEIIKDLRHYANPKEAKIAIAELRRQGDASHE
jgi:hypothetical protein